MRIPLLASAATLLACTHDFDTFLPRDGGTDAAVVDTPAGCNEPGSVLSKGHCYFATAPLAWAAAKKACEDKGAHLVTITSSEEQGVAEGIAAAKDAWIGLSRPPGSPSALSSFTWITGEKVSYLKWSTGEPSGAGECGRLKAGTAWGDAACTASFVALCERE